MKVKIPALLAHFPLICAVVDSLEGLTPSCIDGLVDGSMVFLCLTVDSVAPLKQKVVNPRWFVPWYNAELLNRNVEG